MRRAAKIDANQRAIVEALRQAGASVLSLAAIGQGCPDLLVGRAGQTFLLEIKAGRGKLTPDQIEWHNLWRGQVAIVRTPDEALAAVGLKII